MSDKIDGFNGNGAMFYTQRSHVHFSAWAGQQSLNVNYMSSAGGLVVNTTKKARKEDNTNNWSTNVARISYSVSDVRTEAKGSEKRFITG